MDGHTISLTRGTTSISYTGLVGGSLADTMAAINTRSAEAGLGISAYVNGSVITFEAEGCVAAGAFTTTLDAVNGTKVSAGADVVGTIDGQTATGLGDVL
jgi:hypothetical protein